MTKNDEKDVKKSETPQPKLVAHEEQKEISVHEEHKAIAEHAEDKTQELEEQLKRLQAEFENYKKRADKEREDYAVNASAVLMKKILPLIEEFELALVHAKSSEASKAENAASEGMVTGFEMLLKNFKALLEKEGLREMNCKGEQFDPYKHEAIKSEESDVEDGGIISVVRKGYYFKDKVLKHANVIVSKGRKGKECDVCG